MLIWNAHVARRLCSLILILPAGPVAAASLSEHAWTLDTQFFVSGSSHYQGSAVGSVTYASVANTAYLKISSIARPYSFGLFAEYRVSTLDQSGESLSAGAAARYNYSDWDATGYAFISKSPSTASRWFYAGRLRYRIADKHKIGLESYGAMRSSSTPKMMLGYYGSVSDSLSFNAYAGSATSGARDLSARAELTWQVR